MYEELSVTFPHNLFLFYSYEWDTKEVSTVEAPTHSYSALYVLCTLSLRTWGIYASLCHCDTQRSKVTSGSVWIFLWFCGRYFFFSIILVF